MRTLSLMVLLVACKATPEVADDPCDKPLAVLPELFSGETARTDAERWCAEFGGTVPQNTITVRDVDWADLGPLDCLCSVGDLVVSEAPNLTEAELPRLASATTMNFFASDAGMRVSLPALTEVSVISVQGAYETPVHLSAPALRNAIYIAVSGRLDAFPDLSAIERLDRLDVFVRSGVLADMPDQVLPVGDVNVEFAERQGVGGLPCFNASGVVTLARIEEEVLQLPLCTDSITHLALDSVTGGTVTIRQPMEVTEWLSMSWSSALPDEVDLRALDAMFLRDTPVPTVDAREMSRVQVSGVADLTGLDSVAFIEDLTILGQAATGPLTGLDSLTEVGSLIVRGDYSTLEGFGELFEAESVELSGLSQLRDITTFRRARTIGALVIEHNDELQTLDGLLGLERVDELLIRRNEKLPTAEAEELRDAIDELGSASISDTVD